MVCVAHPPPQVAVVIAASPASESEPTFRPVGRAAANYVNDDGRLDFSCFKHSINVKLTLKTRHVHFARHHALLFAYHEKGHLRRVTRHVRQFPVGVHRLGARTIVFNYRNASNCGIPHGPPDCPTSEYALVIRDSHGRIRTIDPPINNGGNNY